MTSYQIEYSTLSAAVLRVEQDERKVLLCKRRLPSLIVGNSSHLLRIAESQGFEWGIHCGDQQLTRQKRSGRAGCKGTCKQQIEKGHLRLGSISSGEFNRTYYRHFPGCVTDRVCSNVISAVGSVENIPGFDDLNDDDKAMVKETFESMTGEGEEQPKKKKAPKKKKGADEEEEEDEEEDEKPESKKKPTKKAKDEEDAPKKKRARATKSKKKSKEDDEEDDEE